MTDYSSLMFDYAVLDRPIVVHAPDWELYKDTRGVYFDLMAEPPGVVVPQPGRAARRAALGAVDHAEADARGPRSARASARWRTAMRPSASCAGSCSETARPPRRPRPRSHEHGAGRPQLLLVVGVGRSGTSLIAGMLGQIGFQLPQPEVKADDTNPRGFGEPRWVVDFHHS